MTSRAGPRARPPGAPAQPNASVAALARRGVERSASPSDAIVSHARRGAFDLIVMGTHARKGLSRLVTGSVAEHVMREAPCPVLTIHLPHE